MALLTGLTLLCSAQKRIIQNAHFGVIYPVSTNGTEARNYTNIFSFHIFSGLSGSEKGFALSGITTIIKDSASGLQIAGISNHIGSNAKGVQIAGIANVLGGTADGLQIAGIINTVEYNSKGLQIAGLLNKSLDGTTQIAGLVNSAANLTMQLGGLINKSGNVSTQIAGLVNIAGKVKGAQIAGLINIADSSDYPIGIINLIKKGEKNIALVTDESLTTVLSFRSGGRVMYGILGAGYNLKSEKQLYALEAGLGAHLKVSNSFRFNAEGISHTLMDFHSGEYFKFSLRVMPALSIGRVELFAGPSLNYVNYSNDKGKDLVDHYAWSETKHGRFKGLYAGMAGGVQIRL